ncbi:MAG: bioC [Acidobacteriaceae bacterium]|nr:bioC [Acidobacteriaceae bacterium]
MSINGSQFPPYQCPVHKTRLSQSRESLVCTQGHQYPIRAGVPRFVPTCNYAQAFGAQWKRYRLTQLDSYTGTTITRSRLQRCLGPALWAALKQMQVLECGCGAGRFTEVLLEKEATVTSLDLSDAVDANFENFAGSGGRHRVAQADILGLPFPPMQYDIVLCLGVVQHTPNPESAIRRLWDQVKPGGYLVFDQYRYRLYRCTTISPLFRQIIKRLPRDIGLQCTAKLVNLTFPILTRLRKYPVLVRSIGRVVPVAHYFYSYPELNEKLQYEWSLLDTHDSLSDWYRHYTTVDHTRRLLNRLGADNVECWEGGNGVEARIQRAPISAPNTMSQRRLTGS